MPARSHKNALGRKATHLPDTQESMHIQDIRRVDEDVRDEITAKIHNGFDLVEFVRAVWDYDAADILSKPMPTALHPEAECYTLPHDAVAAYHVASERTCKPHLVTIFTHLQKQLFGDPEFRPNAQPDRNVLRQVPLRLSGLSKTNDLCTGDPNRGEISGRVLRPLPSRTVGASSTYRYSRCRLKQNRLLDTRLVDMEKDRVMDQLKVYTPEFAFSTIKGSQDQSWTWLLAFGGVTKVAHGKRWVHTGDIKIPLDRLKESTAPYEEETPGRKRKQIPLRLPTNKRSRTQASGGDRLSESNNIMMSKSTFGTKAGSHTGKKAKEIQQASQFLEKYQDRDEMQWQIPPEELDKSPLTDDEAQMAQYMKMMMSHGIRSYGSGFMIRDTKMRLWYADRMGVIVSQSFDIFDESDLLLLVVAAMSSANARNLGICPLIKPRKSRKFESYAGARLVLDSGLALDEDGNYIEEELKFKIDVDVQRRMHAQDGIVSRATTVFPVTATPATAARLRLDRNELVAKISWPGSTWVAEHTSIMLIRKKLREHKPRFLQHVVEVLCSVEQTMNDRHLPRCYMGIRTFEPRVFRTLVLQKYEKLEHVDSVEEFKGVFIDVVRAHHWVFETSGILHRDISDNNIMFYRKGGRTYGVLCDWDLAMRRDLEKEKLIDYPWEVPYLLLRARNVDEPPRDKGQRAGKVPFMALEFLRRDDPPLHRYRHDLESFFYVLAYFCAVFRPTEHRLEGFPDWEGDDIIRVGDNKMQFVHREFDDVYTGGRYDVHPDYCQLALSWGEQLRSLISSTLSRTYSIQYEMDMLTSLAIGANACQANIRALKAERNALLTYETFMECLGEAAD